MKYYTSNTVKEITDRLSAKYKVIKRYRENVEYLLGRFIYRKIYYSSEFDGSICFNFNEYLTRVLPERRTKEILNILFREGVMEVTDYYKIGIRSNAYSIMDKSFYNYTHESIKQVEVQDDILIKNLKKVNLHFKKDIPDNYKKLEAMLKNYSIDTASATNYIDELYKNNWFHNRAIEIERETGKKSEPLQIKEKYLTQIKFYNSQDEISVDESGRMYSKNTSFAGKPRKCIEINGSNDTSLVDIRSSQPLSLYVYFSIQKDLTNEERNELERYYELLENDIYSSFESIKHIESRDERKILIYKNIYYGDYRRVIHNELNKEFKEMFPLIHARIERLTYKSLELNKKTKDENRVNLLAKELQKVESDFIFNKCVPVILREIPEIILSPIHDCFFVERKFAEDVKNLMYSIFGINYNKQLKIKIENLNYERVNL